MADALQLKQHQANSEKTLMVTASGVLFIANRSRPWSCILWSGSGVRGKGSANQILAGLTYSLDNLYCSSNTQRVGLNDKAVGLSLSPSLQWNSQRNINH
ncbi:hypothetical protein OK016_25295 [Vibrio chagasii]|nr:hypothetical protein [Vibrio chagasii]